MEVIYNFGVAWCQMTQGPVLVHSPVVRDCCAKGLCNIPNGWQQELVPWKNPFEQGTDIITGKQH